MFGFQCNSPALEGRSVTVTVAAVAVAVASRRDALKPDENAGS